MPSFSNTLEHAIHSALALANDRSHEFATLEHLLLALIDEPEASQVLKACSVDIDELRATLTEFVDDDLSNLVTDIDGSEAAPTAAFQRVIQRAAIHVQSSGRTEVTGANVLVAIFAERESNAAFFLQEQEMTRYDAVNFIAHGVAKDPAYGEERTVTGTSDMIVAAFDSKHLQTGGRFNGQSTAGIGRGIAVKGGIGDVGRCLRSRNAKSTAFVAGGVVLKSNVVQLEKRVFSLHSSCYRLANTS